MVKRGRLTLLARMHGASHRHSTCELRGSHLTFSKLTKSLLGFVVALREAIRTVVQTRHLKTSEFCYATNLSRFIIWTQLYRAKDN